MKEQSLMRTVLMTVSVCRMASVIRRQEKISTHVQETVQLDVMAIVYVSLTKVRMKIRAHRIAAGVIVEEVSPVMIMAFVPQMKHTIIAPQTVQIPGRYGHQHLVQVYKYIMHMD